MICTPAKALNGPVRLLAAVFLLSSCIDGDNADPEGCKTELQPSPSSLVGEWMGDFEISIFAGEDADVAVDGCEGSIDLVLEESGDNLSGSGTCDCQPSDFYPGILEAEYGKASG